jgi:hypothetical protein
VDRWPNPSVSYETVDRQLECSGAASHPSTGPCSLSHQLTESPTIALDMIHTPPDLAILNRHVSCWRDHVNLWGT